MSALLIIKKIKNIIPKLILIKLPKEIRVVEIKSRRSGIFNEVYRGRKEPTNVLSFNYGSGYGEILVCPELIRQEAKKQGNSYAYQMTWMILHGMIHLTGIHHERSKGAQKNSDRLESAILSRIFGDSKSKLKS